MDHIEISKTSGAEFISHQLLKFVVNPNPMAALVNGFCDYLNMQQVNNIIDVLDQLKDKIAFVQEQIIGKLYVNPPVFKNDILPTLQKAKDELNAEKRKMYATYIMACIHPDSLDCSNNSIYLNLLDQLDYLSIFILKQLDYCTTEKSIVEKAGTSYDKDVVLVHLWGLQPCGLVEKISAKEFESMNKRGGNRRLLHPEGVFLYKRTGLGNSFLNFIVKGMPEDNNNEDQGLVPQST